MQDGQAITATLNGERVIGFYMSFQGKPSILLADGRGQFLIDPDTIRLLGD